MNQSVWNTQVVSQPLTEEVFLKGVEALMKRDKWEREHPHGHSSENRHIVSVATKERLIREGGYGMCGLCGVFYIPPPDHPSRVGSDGPSVPG